MDDCLVGSVINQPPCPVLFWHAIYQGIYVLLGLAEQEAPEALEAQAVPPTLYLIQSHTPFLVVLKQLFHGSLLLQMI